MSYSCCWFNDRRLCSKKCRDDFKIERMAKSSDRSGGLRQSLSPLGHLYNRPAHAQNNDDLRRAVAKLSVSSVLDGSPISVRPVAATTRSRYEGSRSTYSRFRNIVGATIALRVISRKMIPDLRKRLAGVTDYPCPDTAASIHFWANTTTDMK